ncbi:hypothetical protein T05_14548, partial [Trichinella murrelli]
LEMNTEPVDSKKSSPNSALAKLPTWSILKFTGKVLDFSSFWEQFNAGIHDNAELADVTKFIYLRSLLEGEGLKAIDGYAVTQGNYPDPGNLTDRLSRDCLLTTVRINWDERSKANETMAGDLSEYLQFIGEQAHLMQESRSNRTETVKPTKREAKR